MIKNKDMVYTFNIHSCSILSEIEVYFDFFFKCFTIIFNFYHFISETLQCCTKWGCRFGTGLSSQRCWSPLWRAIFSSCYKIFVCKGVWTPAANNRNVFVLQVIHFVIFPQPHPPYSESQTHLTKSGYETTTLS
jgi:hypothetical protein